MCGAFRNLSSSSSSSSSKNAGGININKHLASMGLCSRREANDFVQRGLVLVNGRTATVGELVDTSRDKVSLVTQVSFNHHQKSGSCQNWG